MKAKKTVFRTSAIDHRYPAEGLSHVCNRPFLSKSEAFERIAQHINELIDANRAAMKAKKTARKGGKETDGTPAEVEM